ncbi:MAG: 1-acyl-sn-glycerol-3-phosphate acyltransferase [Actinobacteria bacterium]|nr:1-acyl-sn-glycerol-3-phosphate acyltransferase [Actinomycetota bacterium]MBU1944619.1 1-acyl-sn-glycerol-3-phosphate acyltransferase [Actinomycetota bacterium]MBU2689171.1 1-acyl-sn-glycerol-3-phosphate acyltransferase [Actinomycetota bacterium]
MDVNQLLVYTISKMTIGPLVRFKLRLKSEGAWNIPEEGPALIVCNHRNPVLDPMSLALSIERPVNFIAASVAFKLPVISQLFWAWGVSPVDVFGGEKSRAGLESAVNMLKDGELVGVFPEGVHTIAKLHAVAKVRTFRTGFARIAFEAKVPVIPTCVIGSGERNLPRIPPALVKPFFDHPDFQQGVQWNYYKRARVRIGRPLDLSEYYKQEMTKEIISEISGKVRRIVMKLYNGEDLDRFLTGEKPFDIYYDRV